MSGREREAGKGKEARGRRLVSEEEFPGVYESLRGAVERALDPSEPWAIVGIKRGGAIIGRRLWSDLRKRHGELAYGEVDISLYRDDYHLQVKNPRVLGTEVSFPVDGASIILVDDVLFTGRTVRAAMDLLLDFGRPRRIWLAVFVDRGDRELPIAANFVGRTVSAGREERVVVRLKEFDAPLDAVDAIPGENDR